MTALLAGRRPRSRPLRVLIGLLAVLLPLATATSCNQVREQAGNVIEGLDLTDGVPPDFPVDDVPLIEGPVRGASQTDADGEADWVVIVDAEDAGETAREELVRAGYEITHTVSTDSGVLAELAGHGFAVKLIASTSRVVYVVTPN